MGEKTRTGTAVAVWQSISKIVHGGERREAKVVGCWCCGARWSDRLKKKVKLETAPRSSASLLPSSILLAWLSLAWFAVLKFLDCFWIFSDFFFPFGMIWSKT